MNSFKPTFAKVQRDLSGFHENIILYVYHSLNGRDEEAASYLEEYKCEQHSLANDLIQQQQQIEELKEDN